MFKGLLVSVVLLVVCVGCNQSKVVAEHPNDNVLLRYDVRRINVDGVDCVIAGSGFTESGAALSCNWGN